MEILIVKSVIKIFKKAYKIIPKITSKIAVEYSIKPNNLV